MKKRLIPVALIVLAATAVPLAANMATFRINFYLPTMKSDFWDIEFNQMTLTKTNFQDISFGLSYELFLTRELSLVFSFDTYSKSKSGVYKGLVGYSFDQGDFAFPDDFQGEFQPGHTIRYQVSPLQFSVKLTPFGRRIKLIPYLGAGVGLYLFSLRMQGDMIDFSDEYVFEDSDGFSVPVYPIYSVDVLEGKSFGKIGFGYHLLGGLMYPIGNRLTVEGEFKYNKATGKMSEFQGFAPLDIGGFQISLGFNYWF